MTDATATADKKRVLTATKIGVVTSDKADKTRTVSVEYQQKHPKYGKFLRRQAKFHAHDEKNESRTGDRVEIASCRPLSKTKTWRIVRVVEEGVRQEH
ncbi:MAG: 30S ribosomal protein S17 [Planctomycetota bacterium]